MKKILTSSLKWIGSTKLLAIPRNTMANFLTTYYTTKGKVLFDFCAPWNLINHDAVANIRKIKQETNMLLTDTEAYLIYDMVKKTEKVPGAIAEVGVYRGGSAKIIRTATQKPLHLFDTYEGLPEISTIDNPGQFQKGQFYASLEDVQRVMRGCSDVYFYKGLFPATATTISNTTFSFVHLDVDIYESTLEGLRFFYPRLARGGVLISHDYPSAPGVVKAFEEFFADKPEIIVQPFSTNQALVVKL